MRVGVEVEVGVGVGVAVGVGVGIGVEVGVGDYFPTTSHSIFYSRVGPIAIFSHCKP